jgi:hypothetical protein
VASNSKSALERANSAAAKDERVRDGKLALREYQLNQSAVLTNMQRLRALRLSHEGQQPSVIEPPKPSSSGKRRAGKND